MSAKWIFFVIGLVVSTSGSSQCDRQAIWDSIVSIEKSPANAFSESKRKLIALKSTVDNCKLQKDSVYARLLHRLAAVLYQDNHNVATDEAIDYLSEAIRINASGKPSAATGYLVNNYYNMGLFYRSLKSYRKASLYFDSTIVTDARLNTRNHFSLWAGYFRASLFFKDGEFQKCINECNRALVQARSANSQEMEMRLLNELSQSYLYLGRFPEAMEAATRAKQYAVALKDSYEEASALKNEARVLAEEQQLDKADALFRKVITERQKTKDYSQLSDDFIDWGVFYIDTDDYEQSKLCFRKAIEYAKKGNHKDQLAKAWLNLSFVEIDAPAKNYLLAEEYLNYSLQQLGIHKNSIHDNIYLNELTAVGDKNLLVQVLRTKVDLLLRLYKENPTIGLDNCIKTARLTDSLLTDMRLQHTEEQSKLYWRNLTKRFFSLALEACYRAGDMKTAFYFMEKSRAVLLYEKINELAAAALLPESEIRKELRFKYQIVAVERLLDEGREVNRNQERLIQLKDSLERHVKLLEASYPEYHRIKYASTVPGLDSFQQHLSLNGEAFVYYFFDQNKGFAFVATATGARMHELTVSSDDFSDFIAFCSNKQNQNNSYINFEKLAEKLYLQLFAPLKIEQERVIVCMDNYLLPFEAFRTNAAVPDFLISQHTFSYAYSAAALLFEKKYRQSPSSMFAGFAPVSFSKNLSLPDLKLSGKWLNKLSSFYSSNGIFTEETATKQNFIYSLSNYSIVNVFSHATADTIEREPVLYLQDSAINLRELQALDHSAAQLVILSACQTNVGRNESGEGIYSLARGFSSIGIPSVTSTLWTADEEATYWISEKFHRYLRNGMNKDVALKNAKLDFMRSGARASLLPYYWANIVLVGNNSVMDFTGFKKVEPIDLVMVFLMVAVGLMVYWYLRRLVH